MRTMPIIQTALLSCSLFGCTPPPLEDISHWPEYAGIIGTKIRAKDELLAFGITIDKNYKKRADYILITQRPGISGPEVVSTEKVSNGTVFRISGVVRYGYFLVYEIHYVLEPLGAPSVTAPFHVKKGGATSDPNAGLNMALFQKSN